MDAIQPVGAGMSPGLGPAAGVPVSSAGTAGGAMAGASASASAYSATSLVMESGSQMIMAQDAGGGDRVEQMLKALILLLVLLQMQDEESKDKTLPMLMMLADAFASQGRSTMAVASYQSLSLTQVSAVEVATGSFAMSGGGAAAGGQAGGQIDVVA
ncbi:MAG TPA: hypothetical protein VMZ31_18665 [Phycisphaerae bacterium]|nr:hypothetical protein [Phycisphaerae bacterium]